MSPTRLTAAALALLLPVAFGACSSEGGAVSSGEQRGEHAGEHSGEHSGEHGGAGHAEEGEESGTQYELGAAYDETRNGARLVLKYDAESHSFVGTVENTTAETLERVRVEVHLSNGVELGPTEPVDLAPGAQHVVQLSATSRDFETWSAHPEVGSGEHH